MEGSTLRLLIILLAIGAVGGISYAAYKRLKGRPFSPRQKESGKMPSGTAPRQSPAEKWIFFDNPEIFKNEVGGLWNILYSSLNSLALARNNFNNISQAIKYKASDGQKSWWNKFSEGRDNWSLNDYKEKAEKLISLLMSAGIKPLEEDTAVWGARADLLYIPLDDINEGQKCKILSPAWLYKGVTFEKGIIKSIDR